MAFGTAQYLHIGTTAAKLGKALVYIGFTGGIVPHVQIAGAGVLRINAQPVDGVEHQLGRGTQRSGELFAHGFAQVFVQIIRPRPSARIHQPHISPGATCADVAAFQQHHPPPRFGQMHRRRQTSVARANHTHIRLQGFGQMRLGRRRIH